MQSLGKWADDGDYGLWMVCVSFACSHLCSSSFFIITVSIIIIVYDSLRIFVIYFSWNWVKIYPHWFEISTVRLPVVCVCSLAHCHTIFRLCECYSHFAVGNSQFSFCSLVYCFECVFMLVLGRRHKEDIEAFPFRYSSRARKMACSFSRVANELKMLCPCCCALCVFVFEIVSSAYGRKKNHLVKWNAGRISLASGVFNFTAGESFALWLHYFAFHIIKQLCRTRWRSSVEIYSMILGISIAHWISIVRFVVFTIFCFIFSSLRCAHGVELNVFVMCCGCITHKYTKHWGRKRHNSV